MGSSISLSMNSSSSRLPEMARRISGPRSCTARRPACRHSHTHCCTYPSGQVTHIAIHVHPDRSHAHRYTCPSRHSHTHCYRQVTYTATRPSRQVTHITTHVHLHVTHHYTCPSRQVTYISDLSFLYLHMQGTNACPSCYYLTCPDCTSPDCTSLVFLHLPCPACI